MQTVLDESTGILVFCCQRQHQPQQPFYGPLSGTTRLSRYQKKHPPTHHPDYHPIFISFFHLPRSIASSLFKLRAWQFFCTTSFDVFFGLPLGLEPSTSYSIHFFTQSVSSFHSTCPYHRNLFWCISIISSIPSLSLSSLLGTLFFTLRLHIHLTILISARWSATSFSFLTGGQVSLPCSILLRTLLLYSLPLLISDISLFVSNVTNCLNLLHPIRILASTAASASPFCCQRPWWNFNRVTTLPGKSWNLVRPFSKPGKSWTTAKFMESHGKWWRCPGIFL